MSTIGLLYNPISGAGRGKIVATRLAERLGNQGFTPILRETQPSYETASLLPFLQSLDVLLVIGGDGTMRALLHSLSSAATPVYLVPCGNESLFARHFGMTAVENSIVKAIVKRRVVPAAIARINDSYFFHMVSLGLDSLVVAKIAQTRRGPIGHIGYALPTMRSIVNFSAPQLTVTVDGKTIVNQEPGLIVAANTSQYARNLRLIPEATGEDGRLHLRFFPFHSVKHYLPWIWNFATARPASLKNTRYASGLDCVIDATHVNAWPIQADGEHVGSAKANISIGTEKINILMPI